MTKELVVTKKIRVNTDISKVWEALTNPEITKKYFFDCEAISDWKVGSPIEFRLTSEGKGTVAVKGVITAIEPQRLLEHTCFTLDIEDDPSKHTIVSYKLSSTNGGTELTVTQGDFGEDETRYNHTDTSWDHVLAGLKTLLESQK